MNTITYGENKFGVKQTLPGSEIESKSNQEISLDFRDVNSKNYGNSNL